MWSYTNFCTGKYQNTSVKIPNFVSLGTHFPGHGSTPKLAWDHVLTQLIEWSLSLDWTPQKNSTGPTARYHTNFGPKMDNKKGCASGKNLNCDNFCDQDGDSDLIFCQLSVYTNHAGRNRTVFENPAANPAQRYGPSHWTKPCLHQKVLATGHEATRQYPPTIQQLVRSFGQIPPPSSHTFKPRRACPTWAGTQQLPRQPSSTTAISSADCFLRSYYLSSSYAIKTCQTKFPS